MAKKYDVISPDGISIARDERWDNVNDAQKALTKWMERYEAQGYYSSNGEKIPLNELESRCTIKPIKNT
jgi:hypothetical protein